MVRGFGTLLVIGIVIAFCCALTAGSAALALAGRGGEAWPGRSALRHGRRAVHARRGDLVGARRAARASPPPRSSRCAGRAGGPRDGRGRCRRRCGDPALSSGCVLAAAPAGPSTPRRRWSPTSRSSCPRTYPRVRDLTRSRGRPASRARSTSRAREGPDRPEGLAWMRDLPGARSSSATATQRPTAAGRPSLCPALSLHRPVPATATRTPTRAQVAGLLDAVPPYFSQAVITKDRRTATGVRDAARVARRAAGIFDDMRARLDAAPGVTAGSAGRGADRPGANATLRTRCGGSA